MDDRYRIETPENIELSYTIAGIGSRFLAAIVDTLILVLIQLALGFLLLAIGLGNVEQSDTVRSLLLALWGLLSFVFLWGYYILFEMIWNGQSPGKRIYGLRVVREGGRPVSFVVSAIRNLVRIIDFLPAFYGLGVVTMFIDERARRLGDLAAGSLVVKERGAVTLESLTAGLGGAPPSSAMPYVPVERSVPASPAAVPLLPNLHLLSDADYALVDEFLRRRPELGAESRARLGAQLADRLRARLGLPPGGSAELFLENIAREYPLARTGPST